MASNPQLQADNAAASMLIAELRAEIAELKSRPVAVPAVNIVAPTVYIDNPDMIAMIKSLQARLRALNGNSI